MNKVLVRKQMFDPKQAANNMAAVTDLSSSGAVEQLGLLNLLSGPQKPLAPAAAKELGYDMDSPQYRRLRMGERIGQGLAGAYGGFRALDALGSGRSPTSAIGAGAGAYGSLAPIASRVGVRAASTGMKPAEKAPVAVAPPVPEKIEYNPVFDPVTFGQMERGRADTIQYRFQPKQVAVAQPQPFRQPTPQEARVNRLDPQQAIFTSPYTGGQLPRNMPEMAGPTPEDKAEGFTPDHKKELIDDSQVAVVNRPKSTQPEITPEQKRLLSYSKPPNEIQEIEDDLDFLDVENYLNEILARKDGSLQGA